MPPAKIKVKLAGVPAKKVGGGAGGGGEGNIFDGEDEGADAGGVEGGGGGGGGEGDLLSEQAMGTSTEGRGGVDSLAAIDNGAEVVVETGREGGNEGGGGEDEAYYQGDYGGMSPFSFSLSLVLSCSRALSLSFCFLLLRFLSFSLFSLFFPN